MDIFRLIVIYIALVCWTIALISSPISSIYESIVFDKKLYPKSTKFWKRP
ncbi:MAG: hypothetical protein AAF740_03350 [Bacteroidota bacterium]